MSGCALKATSNVFNLATAFLRCLLRGGLQPVSTQFHVLYTLHISQRQSLPIKNVAYITSSGSLFHKFVLLMSLMSLLAAKRV